MDFQRAAKNASFLKEVACNPSTQLLALLIGLMNLSGQAIL